MALVSGPTHTGARLRCPYHGWEFASADGSLVRLPQRSTQFATCDLSDLGLLPASVAEWEGMLFVHADADPPSFDALITAFAAGIGSFRPGLLEQVAHVQIEVGCNWKLFVENHIDVYHLWYLHEETLGDFDHARFEHREIGPNWVSYEPLRRSSVPPAGPTIEHLAARDRHGIGAHLLFPNMTMASTAEYFITYSVFPVDPTSSRIDLRVRAEDRSRADELVATVRAFIDEDIDACQRIQHALRSPRFGVGALARTHEQTIVRFHDQLLTRLGSTTVAPPVRRAVPA
jgi:phenylpropionate dioxygenase-like ring-hydroxylating dioxygenase large terminal subunit